MAKIVTPAELEQLIASGKPVVADFFADWCQPCKMMAPTVDAAAEAFAGRAEVVKVNIEADDGLMPKYGLRGVPTFIVFRGGKQAAAKSGALGRSAFLDWAGAQIG
ncbi:thioredoxin family protein [Methylibium petroleiphilum]|uniref:Thioredoxin n=1 Tax=Methylibium petroleiphilum (strain ATCC BAA-1232 / LMG 22953 / PM1) TaxID=420662 RepID=A2SN69_METPP|nr:thioredoxin domain-containing protein [Methylibium petroleiphilum]ABM97008.1 thioredoxin 1 [Methylibium petroleiphilum PM1]